MRLSLFLLVCALFSSNALRAAGTQIVYSNFNPAATPYSTGSGLSVVAADAVEFTDNLTPDPGFSYAVNDVEFLFSASNNTAGLSTNGITVSIYGTTNGLPGSLIGSVTGNLSDTSFLADVQFTSPLPVLQEGQQHWVALSDPITNDLEWYPDGNPDSGVATYDTDSLAWTDFGGLPQGAVQVNAVEVALTATPEPATFLALGTGLFLVLWRRLQVG